MSWRKLTAVIGLLAACSSPQHAVQPVAQEPKPVEEGGVYDEDLATELRADEYGMAQYVVVFLKRGPNQDQSEEEAMELQKAHLANIQRLADEGKLLLAGPFMDDGDVRGIYIFDVTTVDEARELTATDPAIKAGRLEMELRPWFGSAAVREVNAIHERIAKTKF